MNRTAAIRDYIAANPGCTVAAIREATGLGSQMVSNACKKMAGRGLLISTPIEGVYNRCTYTTGRAVLIDRAERAHIANRNKAAARRSAAEQPSVRKTGLRAMLTDLVRRDPQVAYGETPDTEAWLAAGGHLERLPGFRYQYARCMPLGPRYG